MTVLLVNLRLHSEASSSSSSSDTSSASLLWKYLRELRVPFQFSPEIKADFETNDVGILYFTEAYLLLQRELDQISAALRRILRYPRCIVIAEKKSLTESVFQQLQWQAAFGFDKLINVIPVSTELETAHILQYLVHPEIEPYVSSIRPDDLLLRTVMTFPKLGKARCRSTLNENGSIRGIVNNVKAVCKCKSHCPLCDFVEGSPC